MECSISNPALSLLMKHLVIGQRRKTHNLSAFHCSPHGSLVSIAQHFITTHIVHLPKRTETKHNYRIGPKRTYSSNRARLCGPCIAAISGLNIWVRLFKLSVSLQYIFRQICYYTYRQVCLYFIQKKKKKTRGAFITTKVLHCFRQNWQCLCV